jgi:transposase
MAAYVPIDLHRHRSVVMQMAEGGEVLGWTRLANDPETLVAEVLKSGEAPEVAIEATYGWYWAVDALQAAGAHVHLVAPSKLTAFEGRRVKNDQRDCKVLGDLLRANMLPEAWISTPQVREWRELVRYRALCRHRHKARDAEDLVMPRIDSRPVRRAVTGPRSSA